MSLGVGNAAKDSDLERYHTSMQMEASVSSAGVQSFMSAALHINARDTAGALRAISASAVSAVAQVSRCYLDMPRCFR